MTDSATEKAAQVRGMFAGIAHRYDFLNHFLSLGTDILWRKRTVRALSRKLPASPSLLDLCCGTGDLAMELSRLGPVTGCDFCHPMLVIGREKVDRMVGATIRLVEGDALSLPFPDSQFDGVTVAFGVRNYADLNRGLAEILRVLRPGGTAAILEFSRPVLPGFRELFLWYFHRVLPHLGRWISGKEGAYHYLPESVGRFPDAPGFARILEQTGFEEVQFRRFTFGVAALHMGRRPAIPRGLSLPEEC